MGTRLQLHSLLSSIPGVAKVYYQPPSSVSLSYPCIIYEISQQDVKHADDMNYRLKKRYTITVIDKNPDSLIPDKVRDLPLCSYDRHYTIDYLHHDVFNIYY